MILPKHIPNNFTCDVRLCCNNPQCKSKCNKECFKMNEHTASFSLAFRTCSHSRTIDPLTHLEPLDDHTRAQLGLAVLKDFQKRRRKKKGRRSESLLRRGEERRGKRVKMGHEHTPTPRRSLAQSTTKMTK